MFANLKPNQQLYSIPRICRLLYVFKCLFGSRSTSINPPRSLHQPYTGLKIKEINKTKAKTFLIRLGFMAGLHSLSILLEPQDQALLHWVSYRLYKVYIYTIYTLE
jgi:hypothetical protein